MKDNLNKSLCVFIISIFTTITLAANEKATIKSHDFISENMLHDAVRSKDMGVVKYLVNQGVEINLQDDYGYTPLHLSVRLGTLLHPYLLI